MPSPKFNRWFYKQATFGASEGAIKEMIHSKLPGRTDGPADAYRHILLAAELTRRFGDTIAKTILDGHEFTGWMDNQSPQAESMDKFNNNIGINIGRTSRSWNEVVERSRLEISQGNEKVLSPENWKTNPKDDVTNEEIPSLDPRLNWPPIWPEDGKPYPEVDYKPTDGNSDDPINDPPEILLYTISEIIGTTPDPLVKTIRYVDPLILDLDGDGLEITPLSKGVLFDSNGDTVKTGTAWAGADDGLLVWDRNTNGQIDSGREFFGDETLLANGQKAAHGFVALAELDAGSVVDGKTVGAGDHVFDAKDTAYADLRVWRDLNQDGISQSTELQTLVDAGVQSIRLDSVQINQNYGDAILIQNSSFTRMDANGNTSTGQAGSFILAQNSFIRSFEPITVSTEAQAVQNLGGSGWVRDLQEAATQSPKLIDLYHAAEAIPRAGYKAAVADLLREWGNESSYNSASKQALAAGYGLILSDPINDQERGWMDKAIKAVDEERDAFRGTLTAEDQVSFDAMRERMVGGLKKISAYEAFTGYTFLNWAQVQSDALDYHARDVGATGPRPIEVWVPLSQIIFENRNAVLSNESGYIRVTIPAPLDGASHIDVLWERIVDDAAINLLPTIRLSKYLDMVDINFSETNVGLDFSRMNAELGIAIIKNPQEGAALLIDLQRRHGEMLDSIGWNSVEQVRQLMLRAETDVSIRNAFTLTGSEAVAATSPVGTDSRDVFFGDEIGNTFSARAGNDILDGQAGNDSFSGGFGDDVIYGGNGDDWMNGDDGNDSLDGEAGDDQLHGGAGNDVISGGLGSDLLTGDQGDDIMNGDEGNDIILGGDGSDTLHGGVGDDYLNGGAGDDLYLFNAGDGADRIFDENRSINFSHDKVQFGFSISSSNVNANRIGTSLVLSIKNSNDSLTIENYFQSDGISPYAVEDIQFVSGLTWNLDALKAMVVVSTTGDDFIWGYASDDFLNGAEGNDYIDGAIGNDVINGDAGADTLRGESGDDRIFGGADADFIVGGDGSDLLDGGIGDDELYGGNGADTYIFGREYGRDLISNSSYDIMDIGDDAVYLKPGISPEDVQIKRINNDLVLKLIDTGDQLRIKDHFYQGRTTPRSVTEINFSDGQSWGSEYVNRVVTSGTSGDDVIIGFDVDDTIAAGDGNDEIYGLAGNDVLSGGAGNDAIDGGAGADSMIGGLGEDIYLVDNEGDLILENFNEGIDNVKSSISYALTENVENLVLTGAGDINATGNAMGNYLKGNGGDNIFDGGVGDDYLNGFGGNDKYLFGRGDGVDFISGYYDRRPGKLSTLQFKSNVLSTDVVLYRSLNNGSQELVASIAGTNDAIVIGSMFDPFNSYSIGDYGGYMPVQQLKFSDGTVWDLKTIEEELTKVDLLINSENAVEDSIYNWTIPVDVFANAGLGSSLTYTARLADGGKLPSWLSFDVTTHSFNGTPLNSDVHSRIFVLTATDEKGLSAAASFNLTVANTNDAPIVVMGIDDQNSFVSESWNYVVPADAFGDVDAGDNLSYSAMQADGSALPNWLNFHAATRSFSGTPDPAQLGALQIKIVATDMAGATAQTGFSLTLMENPLGGKIIYGTLEADTLYGTQGNDIMKGEAGQDVISGGSGDDEIDGGPDADLMIGGLGGDAYFVDHADDVISENQNEGNDFIHASVSYSLPEHVENILLTGSSSINATGNAAFNYLIGNVGNNILDGGGGGDYLMGYGGDDTYVFGKGSGEDHIIGTYDTRLEKINTIQFKPGVMPNEIVLSRSGTNLMVSIVGVSDTATIYHVFHPVNTNGVLTPVQQFKFADGTVWDLATILAAASGAQPPLSTIPIADQTAVEDSFFTWTVSSNTFTDADPNTTLAYSALLQDGSALPAWLSFDAATRSFTGTPSNADVGALALLVTATDPTGLSATSRFTLTVANTNDAPTVTMTIDASSGVVAEPWTYTVPANVFTDIDAGDNLSYTATRADGSALPAWLSFDPATRSFSGTPNAAQSGVVQIRLMATDLVGATAQTDFSLTVAFADGQVVVTGTADGDTLEGTAGNDILDGGLGEDWLKGGAGDDTFLVRGTETDPDFSGYNIHQGDEGFDTLLGSDADDTILLRRFDWDGAVQGTVERIDGGAGYNTVRAGWEGGVIDLSRTELLNIARIEGGDGQDEITGTAGNDLIDGGRNDDWLKGGAGDDTFLVRGTEADSDFSGYNIHQGDAGFDTILGSDRDDTIMLRRFEGEGAVERIDGGAGYNTVRAGWEGGVMDLSRTELLNIARIEGGDNQDIITGTAGNDIMDGGRGDDALLGGAGDDTFLTHGTEADPDFSGYNIYHGGDGFDTLLGSAADDTILLRRYGGVASVERIDGGAGYNTVKAGWEGGVMNLSQTELVNIAKIEGGDNQDIILGTAYDDTIEAGLDADGLIGGAGNDHLAGGLGNDIYVFGRWTGADTVTENDSTSGNTDEAWFDEGVATDQLWFRQTGNDLEVSIIGTADKVTIGSWYLGEQHHLEKFKTSDGQMLLSSQVQNLVDAMAGFAPPAPGQTTLPDDYAVQLAPTIAANWT